MLRIKAVSTIIIIILFTLWFYSPYLINNYLLPINLVQSKDLAGIYTTVAALFSTLAFGALLLTIFIQNKQLKHQKKELLKSEESHNINIKLAAYSVLLNYYDKNSYDPKVCKLSPRDVAIRLNEIINLPNKNT